MDSVIIKLAEIEEAAEAIVDHAEKQKGEIEKKIQAERDEFDKQLEEDTQKKLHDMRQASENKLNRMLEEEKVNRRSSIDYLEKEFQEKHEIYANEILERIIEV